MIGPRMPRLLIPAALVALALAVTPVLAAGAADSLRTEGEVTWSVEPIPNADGQRRTFEYGVDPGTQIVDKVVVTNAGETPAEFLIYATDAINEPLSGAFGLLERDVEPTDVGGWITLASDKITIGPGQQAVIPFDLLVPSDAAPGEHVAGIVASVVTTDESDEGAAVTLEQRVGARVYLNVSGAQVAGVEVAGVVSTFTPSLNPFAPGDLAIAFDLRNTGNQRVDALTTVAVTGPFGIPLGEYAADPVKELLPRQTVRLTTDIPAIAALALVFSNVTVTPGPVGSADEAIESTVETDDPAPTDEPTADPTPEPSESAAAPAGEEGTDAEGAVQDIVVVDEELAFEPVSETTPALAISWTLLALVVVLLAGAYLLWRYISGTRERLYLAIDEAAETARREERELTAGGER